MLHRSSAWADIKSIAQWDVVIIGGGATGLGAALDSASRGFKTLLVEKYDFAQGTSSKSTKLVHGGVRYLKQGNISLVNDALRERGRLRNNAPHLVRNLAFIIPTYDWWEGPFYGIGLKVYDFLAGKMGLGASHMLSREETVKALKNVNTEDLRGGVIYYDGQFDDARLAIHLAMSAADHGATLINHCEAIGLLKDSNGLVNGVRLKNPLQEDEYEVKAKVVINATGVFVDHIRKMDEADHENTVTPSQGVHIVLPKKFLEGNQAIMVPHTADGRVLFAIPWHEHVVVGTTDTAIDQFSIEPRPLQEELEFVLTHAQKYLHIQPSESDVLSCFAGLRPLVSSGKNKKTASLSRDHTLITSRSGLITITGGKWTTYRKMAEDVIDHAILVGQLADIPCKTVNLPLHGYQPGQDDILDSLSVYGTDAQKIEALVNSMNQPQLLEQVHPDLPYRWADFLWAVRAEMASKLDDILSRRTRCLLCNAQASMEIAPKVADLVAQELGWDEAQKQEELRHYLTLAKGYLWSNAFQASH
jgi:glycerol-3-phosphate dehydrogenase